MYKCSNCGHIMDQPLDRCSSCNVLLSGIKCENCGYIGGKSEFINNNHHCPKCQTVIKPKEVDIGEKCPKCGAYWDKECCENCGHKDVVQIGINLVVGPALIILAILIPFIIPLTKSGELAGEVGCGSIVLFLIGGFMMASGIVVLRVKPTPKENNKASREKFILGTIALGVIGLILLLLFIPTIRTPSNTKGAMQVLQSEVIPTHTPDLHGKTIIGLWERLSTEYTEQLLFTSDGRFTIKARQNSTNEIIAENSGAFTYDGSTIHYLFDLNNKETAEIYYLSQGGDLLVTNDRTTESWKRIR